MWKKLYGVTMRLVRVLALIFLFYEVFSVSDQMKGISKESTTLYQLKHVSITNYIDKNKVTTERSSNTDKDNAEKDIKQVMVSQRNTTVRTATSIITKVVETKIYEHPYSYLHVPISVCKSNGGQSDPFLLVVVKSDVNHIAHRMAIRSTWGKTKPNLKVVFLLGQSNLMESFIEIESDLYKDIVQENFIDDYENNTLKTVMGFNWVSTHCTDTKYVYFVDDDYIVNIKYLWDHVNRLYKDGKRSIFVGCLWVNAKVNRNKGSKWYIPKEEFADDTWPPYVSGGSMILSTDIVRKISSTFKYVKPLFIDDVYLGILAKRLGIQLEHDVRHHPIYTPDRMAYLFASHGFKSPKYLLDDWEKYHIKFDMVV